MKIFKNILVLFMAFLIFDACKKGDEIDTEKPVINISIQGAFPVNCDTLYFGESFNFKVLFSDNVELGSYSIDIHHNFDHHSHSTEVAECNLGPIKNPVNPVTFIQDYEIPAGLKEYEPNVSITLPSENANGFFDEGDYHFYISLTDREGWSAQNGISVKMLHR